MSREQRRYAMLNCSSCLAFDSSWSGGLAEAETLRIFPLFYLSKYCEHWAHSASTAKWKFLAVVVLPSLFWCQTARAKKEELKWIFNKEENAFKSTSIIYVCSLNSWKSIAQRWNFSRWTSSFTLLLLCFTELCLKRSRPPLVATADFHRDRVGWERFSVANLPQKSFSLFQHDFDDGKLCPCSTRLFECPLLPSRYVVVWHLMLSRPKEKSNEDGNDEISAIKIHKSSLSAMLYFCLNCWERFQVSFFI